MYVGRLSFPEPEEDEVRDGWMDLDRVDLTQRTGDALALALAQLDARRDDADLAGDLHRDGLGERADVRGELYRAEDLGEIGMHDEDPDAQAGRGEHLREGLADDHVRMFGELREERPSGEVAVRLVDEHERLGVRLRDREDNVEVDLVPGRVVRRGEDDDLGVRALHRAERAFTRDFVRPADAFVDDGAAGDRRETLVHRVRRLEEEHPAPVPAEHEERLQQRVVAAVAEHELVGRDAVVAREDRTEVERRAGVAVEQHVVQLFR